MLAVEKRHALEFAFRLDRDSSVQNPRTASTRRAAIAARLKPARDRCQATELKRDPRANQAYQAVLCPPGLGRKLEAGKLFYQRLFEIAPDVKPMFKSDINAQAEKLMSTLGLVIANLQDAPAIVSMLENLGQKHVGYGVLEEHYDKVGAALLWTLKRCWVMLSLMRRRSPGATSTRLRRPSCAEPLSRKVHRAGRACVPPLAKC